MAGEYAWQGGVHGRGGTCVAAHVWPGVCTGVSDPEFSRRGANPKKGGG